MGRKFLPTLTDLALHGLDVPFLQGFLLIVSHLKTCEYDELAMLACQASSCNLVARGSSVAPRWGLQASCCMCNKERVAMCGSGVDSSGSVGLCKQRRQQTPHLLPAAASRPC